MKLLGMVTVTAFLVLSGCASPKPTRSTCVVAHEFTFMSTGSMEQQITVARNGSPCVVAMGLGHSGIGGAVVAVPPDHGKAAIRALEESTLISYTPASDYVGPDKFDVAFGPNFTVKVFVQVVDVGG